MTAPEGGRTGSALACLSAYAWRGNVRGLENAVERAGVLGLEGTIWPEDLPEQVVAAAGAREQGPASGYHAAVEEQKRRIIREALEPCSGNQSRTAERLGLQRTYLSRLSKNLALR